MVARGGKTVWCMGFYNFFFQSRLYMFQSKTLQISTLVGHIVGCEVQIARLIIKHNDRECLGLFERFFSFKKKKERKKKSLVTNLGLSFVFCFEGILASIWLASIRRHNMEKNIAANKDIGYNLSHRRLSVQVGLDLNEHNIL